MGIAKTIPTYFFLAMMALTVGTAFWRHLTGSLGTVADPPAVHLGEAQAIGLFLVLHAFSNGTTALTGVEAISNGITAFREPRSRNAGITLLLMSVILGSLFLAITYLAGQTGAVPSEQETVISQIARTAFGGRGLSYLGTMGATTLILAMAANTAFAGFPRLSALQAADGFLPRQLTYRGSRLVFSRGIAALALMACLLIVVFEASVTALIPLYAIGVFLSFTLSQAGMTRRWWRSGQLAPGREILDKGSTLRFEKGWATKMAVNGFGAVCTAVVTVVFCLTKFSEGAWVVVVVIPALVLLFLAIRGHYRDLAGRLSLDDFGAPARIRRHRVLLPISGVHRGTVSALRYARALSDDVTAVFVSTEEAASENVRRKWGLWGGGIRLVILESPYRLLVEPLLDYIKGIAAQRQPNEILTIVVPQFVPTKRWHNLLHAQTAVLLRLALMFQRGIVITSVPYQVGLGENGEEI